MVQSSLRFGTSGLRGLADELNGVPAFSFTRAFAEMLKERGAVAGADSRVLVGRDLRESSPAIARLCCSALESSGFVPVDCGALPTPALAYHGMRFGMPAIMVTGSHIPEDRNGLKFYNPWGEINKRDEERILALHAGLGLRAVPDHALAASRPVRGLGLLAAYKERYLEFFGPGALGGLTVGVYQHSSVARDIIAEILEALGARAVPLGRAESFIPVDTEALREDDERLARRWAGERALDAIVSTDGDADRPLVADEAGSFLRGDLVGAITAAALGADAIVTPITSNSALELSGMFRTVLRTKVGSPFVIEGMAEAAGSGGRTVVGFEANGGVLVGADIWREGRTLAALPTRDAMLPILCVLGEITAKRSPLSGIAHSFGFKSAVSNRLKNVATEISAAFVSRLRQDGAFASGLFAPFGGIAHCDSRDGLRVTAGNGEIIHFRPSGNAPELRIYIEAETPARSDYLLKWWLGKTEHELSNKRQSDVEKV